VTASDDAVRAAGRMAAVVAAVQVVWDACPSSVQPEEMARRQNCGRAGPHGRTRPVLAAGSIRSAVRERGETRDAGSGSFVNRSKFKIQFCNSIFLLLALK
jgi:hypothetical protein